MVYVTDKNDYLQCRRRRRTSRAVYIASAVLAVGAFAGGVTLYRFGFSVAGWLLALLPLIAFLWYTIWFFDVKYPAERAAERRLANLFARKTREGVYTVKDISVTETYYDGLLCRTVIVCSEQEEEFPVYIDFGHSCGFRAGDSVTFVLCEKNVVAYEVAA